MKSIPPFRLSAYLWAWTIFLLLMQSFGALAWGASGTLSGDETWSGTVEVTGSVTVPVGFVLRIEPGTVISFADGTGLTVNGKLIAEGTADAKITFTSASATPTKGKWSGITFNDSSIDASIIEQAVVEYATNGVTCNSANPVLRDSTFRNNSNYGINLNSSTSQVSGSLFTGNGDFGINLSSSNATVKNNSFAQNGNGIRTYHSSPSIRNNIIRDHSSYGIFVEYSGSPAIEFNTIVNSGTGIFIYNNYGGTATLNSNIIVENGIGVRLIGNSTLKYNDVWGNNTNYSGLSKGTTDISVDPQFTDYLGEDFTLAAGSPCLTAGEGNGQIGAYGDGGAPQSYTIALSTTPTTAGSLSRNEQWSGTITLTATVTVPQNLMLQLEPGTTIRFADGTGLIVNGKLIAAGTAAAPITFTSASATPTKGKWSGITFNDSSIDASIIERAVVEYATTGVTCNSASPVLRDSTFRNNSNYGITLNSSSSQVSGSLFTGNGDYGIYLSSSNATVKNNSFAQNGSGIRVRYSNPSIRNNIIRDHSTYGIYVDYSGSPAIEFNTIVNNGTGIFIYNYHSGTATLNSNIIVENGIGVQQNGNSTLKYNDVWGNNNDYSGVSAGGGDITADPLFAGNNDYHLQPTSPCINAGDPFYIDEDGTRADMGAYGALGGYNGDPSNNRPAKPVNAAPADGSTNLLPSLTLSASAFTDPDADDFQIAALWQIREASGSYATPVFDSGIDQQNLISIAVPWGKLQHGATYFWHVRYRDNKSGWSESSQETSFTVTSDSTSPETTITSGPAEGATTATSVTFGWSGSDNLNGPLTWSHRIDEGAWSAFGSRASTTLTGLSHGQHTFRVKSRDYAGNEDTTPATRVFTVDAQPPAISELTVQGSKNSMTVRWTTSEPATSRVQYGTTTDYGAATPLDNALVTSHQVTVPNLAAGTLYHARAVSRDAYGNEVFSEDVNVTTSHDSSSPETTIIQGPAQNALVNLTQVTFGWSGSDDVTPPAELRYAVRLDSGVWSPFAAMISQTLTGLSEGTHTFEVKAQDQSGNDDPTPASRSFTVDVTPPAAPTIGPITTPTQTASQTLSGTRPESSAIVINGVERVPFAASTSWSYVFPLAEGKNLLAIVARDEAGNDSAAITPAPEIVLDTTPPLFTIDTVQNPATAATQTIGGKKEPGCIVTLNGTVIFDASDTSDRWSREVTLTEGITNHLAFTATDALGNLTQEAIDISYDLTAPAPIAIGALVADGTGKGNEVSLSWPSYQEQADLGYYNVYAATADFTSVAGMTPVATVSKGNSTVMVTGLTSGAAYFFAVVPVDQSGGADPVIHTVQATPIDSMPPEEVTALSATSGYSTADGNYVSLIWTPSQNAMGDLADQLLYLDSGSGYDAGTSLGKTATTLTRKALAEATPYKFKLTVKDHGGNESGGVVVQAVTCLANPAGLTAQPGNQNVTLTWQHVSSPYLKEYNIYRLASAAPQTDIGAMTLIRSQGGTNFIDTGLANGTTYQYAVTAANTSGAERSDVISVAATPGQDATGPVIANVSLAANQVITGPLTISATAQDDEDGMGQMQLLIDDIITATQPGGSLSHDWNVMETSDGLHTLKIIATDSLGNLSELVIPVMVSLAPPPVPTISTTFNGPIASPSVTIDGLAQPGSTISLKVNGSVLGPSAVTAVNGTFSFAKVQLVEGDNLLAVKAANRVGESAYSNYLRVIVDTDRPAVPVNIGARPLAGGSILIYWQSGSGETPSGYNLYESVASFNSPTDAGVKKINSTPLLLTQREYLPADDVLRYYAVTALNAAGNESTLSQVVSLAADRVAPVISNVSFSQGAAAPPVDGVYGPGPFNVIFSVSESLKEAPFFSLNPVNGSPAVVAVRQIASTQFEATLTIDGTWPHGPTTWNFSGKDLVGNRSVSSGNGPTFDVRGPAADITAPLTLLKSAGGVAAVAFTLDEPSATVPSLLLKGQGGTSATVAGLKTTDGGRTWTGSLDPEDLAEGKAEFAMSGAIDRFGNGNPTIRSGASLLVYRTSPPAPPVPELLDAKSGKGGAIALVWRSVAGAQAYKIYRRGDGQTTRVVAATIQAPLTSHADTPPTEGSWHYSVSAIGLLNSESDHSAELRTISDRTSPDPPAGLMLSFAGNGVMAEWQQPLQTAEPPALYRLYRSDSPLSDISGLVPAAEVKTMPAIDPSPVKSLRYYALTALDAAGNESAPSATAEITFAVTPVRNLVLARVDDGKPNLSWEAGEAGLQGYHIYRNGQRLTQTPTSSTTYSDGYYAGGPVSYGVSAVSGNGTESPVREVSLPQFAFGLKDGVIMRRGLLEEVPVVATLPANATAPLAIDSVSLKIGGLPESSLHGPFMVTPGTPLVISKVAATENTAPPQVAVVVTAVLHPVAGTTVRITRNSLATVSGAGTALEVFNEPLSRGGLAKVRLKVNNLGSARAEFLTSENGGPASQVKVNLWDADGNLIAQGQLNQQTGAVVNADAYATARIEPGESFLSDPITFPIPDSAPHQVFFETVIGTTYYHYRQDDQVVGPGLRQELEASVTDVSYTASATTDKQRYLQGEPVIITGKAISTASNRPAASVPVKLGVSTKGFDRFFTVTTGPDGTFSYTFLPGVAEVGSFSAWATHPDLAARSMQAQFAILGLSITPQRANLKLVKGQSFDLPVALENTGGSALSGLTFTPTASSGINAAVVGAESDTLAVGEKRNLTLRILVAADAPSTGYASLEADSIEGVTGHLDADITAVAALPVITASPSYIDTGLVRGTQRNENFVIANRGFETLRNVRLEGPSLPWLSLTVERLLGDIGAGQELSIGLFINPGESVPQGIYDDRIVVYADNHAPYTYHLQVTVTSAATGNVQFDVLDELMKDVSGATLNIQHQSVLELYYSLKTAADGSATLFDIPEGRYSFNISAAGRKELSGSFVVTPGLTTIVPIAMEVTLVQIEWSVTPVVLEDRYEVKLNQTFETNVPTPVLITEPPSLTLPELAPGQVFNGEFTITNYGLVEVTDVKIDFPRGSGEYDLETLGNVPARLGPFQKFTISYRVTRRQANLQVASMSTVGEELGSYGSTPCYQSIAIVTSATVIICPGAINQRTVTRSTYHYVTVPIPGTDCSSSGLNFTFSIPYSSGGTGCQGPSCTSQSSSPAVVTPISSGSGDGCIYPRNPDNPGDPDTKKCLGSYLDLPNGTYVFSETDLRVPSRGIPVELVRTYRSNMIIKGNADWSFVEPMDSPLGYGWHSIWFARAGDGMFVDGDGSYYAFASDSAGGYLPHYEGGLTLRKLVKGFEVTRRGGETYRFNGQGRLDSIEDPNGNKITLSYVGTLPDAVTDASGREILRFAYNSSGRVSSVTDIAGRSFSYEYDGKGNLVTVRSGNRLISSYEYAEPILFISASSVRTTSGYYGASNGLVGGSGTMAVGERVGIVLIRDGAQEQIPPDMVDNYSGHHFLNKRTNSLGESYQIEYQKDWQNLGIVQSVTNADGQKAETLHGFSVGEFFYSDYNGNKYRQLINGSGKLIQESIGDFPWVRSSFNDVFGFGGSGDPGGAVIIAPVHAVDEQVVKKIEYLPGRVERITDGAGNITTLQKDEWGQVVKVTNGEGETFAFAYTPDGKPLKVTDPLGVITSYAYDDRGNLVRETKAEGKPEEVVTTYAYNANGELISKELNGAVTRLEYNTAGQPKTITDPLGNKISFEYDAVGNQTAVIDASGNRTEMTYDSQGNRLTSKDPLGNITTYSYNSDNRLTSITDPLGRTTRYDLDIRGRVRAIIDPLGNRREFTYDGNGNLVKIVAGDATTSMTYDGSDRMVSMTDPLGNVTRYEYPGSAGCSSCGGSVDIPKKLVDPLNNATENAFDKAGRVQTVTDPLGNLTATLREKAGRISSMVDANGNTTGYTYDALGRVVKVTDANGGETILAYDVIGNLVTLTDPNGNTTTFTYDQAGRKTRETRPMGQAIEYTYYPNGLLKTVKDAKGQVTTHTYDTAGRLVEITYADGKKDTFGYDAVGNLTSYGNEDVTAILTYDELNRKASETVNFGAFSKTYSYTYDGRGNKASFTSPEGKIYAYTYNKKDQLTSIAFDAKSITFDYQWNRLSKMTFPNGVINDFQHNANAWLSSIIARQGTTTLASSQYGFDKVGNITGKTTERGDFSYLYDRTYQLTQANSPTLPQENFTYDKAGNRLSSAATTSAWTYNQNNELGGYDDVSFAYDANGNTIRKTAGGQTTNYLYNSRDRLETVQLPDGRTAIYTYDPFGRRIRKQVGGETTYFVYADEGLIGEYDPTGTQKKGYGWKPGGLWGANPVFMIEGGQYYFYQNDHLGTPQKMTDINGNLVWSARYTAFGQANVDPGSTVTNNLRFPGQYYDDESGLHYNYFRYYNHETGRYNEIDPMKSNFTDVRKRATKTINGNILKDDVYNYGDNNPIIKIDPDGKSWVVVGVGVAVTAGVVIAPLFYACIKNCYNPCNNTYVDWQLLSKCLNYCAALANLLTYIENPLATGVITIGQEIGKNNAGSALK